MIRMFIGSSSQGEDKDIEMAYEHSLRENSSEELDIVWMRQSDDPNSYWGCWQTHTWPTPFSGFRWGIAEFCNFEGRAIYMDVDQLNLKDIAELYHIDMQGKPFASRDNRLCVMVFDNAKMKNHLVSVAEIKQTPDYGRKIYWDIVKRSHHFDPRWNCLDGEGRPIDDIWHLHFTRMASQPWKPAWAITPPRRKRFEPHKRPDLVQLWEQYRDEAIMAEHNEN